jgi:hypothetical protein
MKESPRTGEVLLRQLKDLVDWFPEEQRGMVVRLFRTVFMALRSKNGEGSFE